MTRWGTPCLSLKPWSYSDLCRCTTLAKVRTVLLAIAGCRYSGKDKTHKIDPWSSFFWHDIIGYTAHTKARHPPLLDHVAPVNL